MGMDLVEFDHVSKRYVLGQRTQCPGDAHGCGLPARSQRRRSPASELWSLRDVSFSVAEGEALGIVGRNGAGKSTILKILAGITAPTAGVVEDPRPRRRAARGRHRLPPRAHRPGEHLPERRDPGHVAPRHRPRFDQIVDFSGVERFLDTPVKRYSSGMYLRLAFAVAAHLEPDILVVDEILAVGDAEFQRKCLGRMQEAEQEGRTADLRQPRPRGPHTVCQRSLWLDARPGPSTPGPRRRSSAAT